MQISNFASMWFILLFVSIAATGILELRWSGVSIEDWWRNEQFWVIGGTSAHLFAVFQGLFKFESPFPIVVRKNCSLNIALCDK